MIKDVMVFLDGTQADESGLGLAEAFATRFGAHLTGLFGVAMPDFLMAMPVEGGIVAAEVFVEIENRAKADADQKQAALRERFKRISGPSEVRRVDAVAGTVAAAIAIEARWGDLLIVPRPMDISASYMWREVAEKALLESGRAVVLLPQGPKTPAVPNSIMIAWKDTPECAHAIAEAAPLISQANQVTLTLVDARTGDDGKRASPAADIAAHVDRLGAKNVEVRNVKSDGRRIDNVLLTEARRMSADIIIMGGYGHSRLREWALGGATRDMLENSEIPVLLAH